MREDHDQAEADQDWPPAPDPAGEMPEGWRPVEWTAYCRFCEDWSIREVAEEVGKSPGTLGTWRKKWRKTYGPGLLASEADDNRSGSGGASPSRRAIEDRGSAAIPWDQYRVALVNLYGQNAGRFLAVVEAMLARYEIRVAAGELFTVDDLVKIVELSDRLSLVADRLAGIPDPNRLRVAAGQVNQFHLGRGDGGAPPPKGVVAALEGRATAPGAKDTLAAARKALEGIQRMKAGAIEVDEAPAP